MAGNDEIKVKLVQSTTGCTLEEAELAWGASDGDEQKAIQMVDMIRPKYLAVKAHFSGSGMKSIEGLVIAILEDGAEEPLYTSCVVVNYSEDPLQVDTTANIFYWQQLITASRSEQSRFNIESSIELQEYIKEEITPEPYYTIMKATCELKDLDSSDQSENAKKKKTEELEQTIVGAVSEFIEINLMQPLKVEVGTELFNEYMFKDISKVLGIVSFDEEDDDTDEPSEEVKERKPIIVQLKGKLVLDIAEGILTKDLRLKDKIAVDIIDRSRLAENVGKLLGLKSQGQWLHAWGVIVDVEELSDNRRRITVEIARNVFVQSVSMNNIKAKCNRKYPGGKRHEYILESSSSIPGYLMVAGMLLFFSLLVKIFMVMANR
ncbi:hypothetical protein J7L05_11100 [bacterium]|nr:hypothetical protein [bacterium]